MNMTAKYLKATNKELPKGWRWVRLGELCEFIRGVTFDKAEVSAFPEDGRVSILRAGNIGLRLDTTNDLIWVPNGRVSSEQLLRVGDAAICMSSGSAEVVGKTAPVEVEWKGSVGAFCGIVRAKDPSTADFVNFWFRSRLFLDWRDDQARGANIQNLRFSQLTKLEIPLPPPPEQRRIATVLREQMAAVEKARSAAQAKLEAIKALPAAFLREVFPQPGQPLPDGWRWVKLGEVCKVVGGSTPDTGNSDYWYGEIVWVTPTDLGKLSDMRITTTDRRITPAGLQSCGTEMLPIGTVIMSSRAPIGHLAIAGMPLCTNQGCKSFVPSQEVDSDFLYWILKQSVPDIQALGSGATFTEVSKSALQHFEIPLTTLSEQQRIVVVLREQVASIEKARAATETELNTINVLPAALLRRAFNGDL